jgi:hypothetical protein
MVDRQEGAPRRRTTIAEAQVRRTRPKPDETKQTPDLELFNAVVGNMAPGAVVQLDDSALPAPSDEEGARGRVRGWADDEAGLGRPEEEVSMDPLRNGRHLERRRERAPQR